MFARIAVKNLKPKIDIPKNRIHFAAIIVNQRLDVNQVWMTFLRSAKSVEKNSRLINIQKSNIVKSAGIKSIELDGNEDVYNLEVADNQNFAVNGGLIVHNCMDSARYFVQTMNIVKKKEKYIPTLYPHY